MAVLLGILKTLYGMNHMQEHFCYSPPWDRKQKVQVGDSTEFLGNIILPGIPAILGDKKLSPGTSGRGGSYLQLFRTMLEKEYTYSPVKEAALFQNFQSRLYRCRTVLCNALENPLLLLLRATKKNQLVLQIDFGDAPVRPQAIPLNGKVIYRLKGRTLHIANLEFQTQEELAKNATAVCGAFTLITFYHHLLSAHLLSVQTIYCLAAKHLPRTHPMYHLIHPHGYQVMGVDLAKGPALIHEHFAKEWSFTQEGAQMLFQNWQKRYRLQDMCFPSWSKRFRLLNSNLREVSSLYNRIEKSWWVTAKYVLQWINRQYPKERDLQRDAAFVSWWKEIQTIPHELTREVLKRKSLATLLTSYIWMSICFHQFVGREAEEIISTSFLYVPHDLKDASSMKDLFLAEEYFQLIHWEATKSTAYLREHEWVRCVPRKFRDLTRLFQKEMIAIDPEFNLGINV